MFLALKMYIQSQMCTAALLLSVYLMSIQNYNFMNENVSHIALRTIDLFYKRDKRLSENEAYNYINGNHYYL